MSAVFDGVKVHEFELLPDAGPHYVSNVDRNDPEFVDDGDHQRTHDEMKTGKIEPGSTYRSKVDLSDLFPDKFRYIGEVT